MLCLLTEAPCACLGYGGTTHVQPTGQGSVRLAAVYGHTHTHTLYRLIGAKDNVAQVKYCEKRTVLSLL